MVNGLAKKPVEKRLPPRLSVSPVSEPPKAPDRVIQALPDSDGHLNSGERRTRMSLQSERAPNLTASVVERT